MKTSSLTIGYFNRPDLTKQSFTTDGWFKSGDLGYLDDDGYLVLAGRSKDLIIRGGENVPVVEIEALLAQHPRVSGVAIVGVPDDRLGEKVCAVVECISPEGSPTLSELCEYLSSNNLTKQFLPQYLLVLSELPRTAVGKIKKQEVRARAVSALEEHGNASVQSAAHRG